MSSKKVARKNMVKKMRNIEMRTVGIKRSKRGGKSSGSKRTGQGKFGDKYKGFFQTQSFMFKSLSRVERALMLWRGFRQ